MSGRVSGVRAHGRADRDPERAAAAAALHPLLGLQRSGGNRAVTGLLARSPRAVLARAVDADALAEDLRAAMEGLGTDEDAVYAALSAAATPADMEAIQASYSALTGRTLASDIRDDFSGAELRRAMDLLELVSRTDISETTDTGNEYTQQLLLDKANARIRIELAVSWVKRGTWADDAAYEAFIRHVKSSAYSYLDNKLKVVCRPTAPGAGSTDINLPITFLIYDMDDGFEIEAHGGTPGGDSFMSESGGEVYEHQSDGSLEQPITFAHEMAHSMLGASDEYANPSVPGRVLTNDHSLMANYWNQGVAQAEIKARHFQHVLAEVATAFAGYTCTLERM